MPVYCDGSAASDTFNDDEDVCVYGVGFDADAAIDIVLEDDSQIVDTTTQTTNDNGVLSLRNLWSNLKRGVYNFFVDGNQNGEADGNEEKQSLFIIGEPVEEDPQDVEEVPEFGTVTSLLVLIIAGFAIYKKRGTQ